MNFRRDAKGENIVIAGVLVKWSERQSWGWSERSVRAKITLFYMHMSRLGACVDFIAHVLFFSLQWHPTTERRTDWMSNNKLTQTNWGQLVLFLSFSVVFQFAQLVVRFAFYCPLVEKYFLIWVTSSETKPSAATRFASPFLAVSSNILQSSVVICGPTK